MSEKKTEYVKKIKEALDLKKMKKDNFIVLILLGVLLLVIVWPVSDSSKPEEGAGKKVSESGLMDSPSDILNLQTGDERTDPIAEESDYLKQYAAYLERKLEEALGTMEGAGDVKVMITLESSSEVIVEKDAPLSRSSVTEVDAQGGSRLTSDIDSQEETVYTKDPGGGQTPYVRQVIQPKIGGVLVVTQGGDNVSTRQNISDAIKALFGLDQHKIKIVKMISS